VTVLVLVLLLLLLLLLREPVLHSTTVAASSQPTIFQIFKLNQSFIELIRFKHEALEAALQKNCEQRASTSRVPLLLVLVRVLVPVAVPLLPVQL
jgi:hypothetical protein